MPQLSYSRGPDIPLREQSVFAALVETARRYPNHEAIVSRHQNLRITYAELFEHVDETARGLAGLGLQPGDRIGVWLTGCVEWLFLFLACARTGLVQVNVNPAYRSDDLAFVLKKSRMKAIFLHAQDSRANYKSILQESRAKHPLPDPLREIYLGEDSWNEMLRNGRPIQHGDAAPEDVLNIQYTSGTTGAPKGVLLTHRNILNNAWFTALGMNHSERDLIVDCFPLYHCAGCVVGAISAFTVGATLILASPQFDPSKALEAVHAERATSFMGSPTMFIAELNHPRFREFDLTSLRVGAMGGSPCPIEIMKRVVDEMHCPDLVVVYGQTEASPLITMSRPDDPLARRMCTIGYAGPNTEVKIVSTDTGETQPVGEQGELCARGYMVMKGYDQEPEATRRAIDEDGWLHTGDLAVMREDGYFRITGRSKDMIIRGGENIYPREIEEFLFTHPKVAEVQVLGLPDAKLGEVVLAWIRLKTNETCSEHEIRAFCEGRIAYFKIPELIRFVEEFPTTVSGKVQKFKIREWEIQQRNLHKAAAIETA